MDGKSRLVFLGIVLLFVSGCTQSDLEAAMQEFSSGMLISNFTINVSQDIAAYPNGTCIMMVCQNKTPEFPYSLFYQGSLKGGNCTFRPCNVTTYNFTMGGGEPGNSTRFFMYGMGPSLMPLSEANRFCNNSIEMGVKWLVGTNYSSYPIADKSRAECMLDKSVIPVYILYSNSTNINVSRAREIASNLSGAGPAIIVSEMDFGDSNASLYSLVKDQLKAMKSACPTCLIGLGVKLNGSSEYNVTREIFQDSYALSSTDLVVYGINSHFFPKCNPQRPFWAAANFSHYVLRNFNKPSLMAYALFDAAPSSDGSCVWTNQTVGEAYSLLYAYMPAMVMHGLIGMSPYSLYGTGPLFCEDCALLDLHSSNVCSDMWNPTPINPRFFNYFGFCQAYYHGIGRNVSGLMPIVFSNGSGNCNFAFNSNIMSYIDTPTTGLAPKAPMPTQAGVFYSCAGCIGNGTIPTSLVDIYVPPDACTKFKYQIYLAADAFDMDPGLLRAASWQESSFDRCALSFLPDSSPFCNPYNLSVIDDPDNCCASQLQVKYSENWFVDTNLSDPVSNCRPLSYITMNGHVAGEKCKPCAYGLNQVVEYPWTIYNAHPSDPIPAAVRACAIRLNNGSPDFNPFRPYDSACAYAYKYVYEALPYATNLVNTHPTELDYGTDENKKEWYAVFLALDMMFGHQDTPSCHQQSETQLEWIIHFNLQRNTVGCASSPINCTAGGINEVRYLPDGHTPACCGNKDFISYVKYCEHNGSALNSFSYAFDVLSRYKSLSEGCQDKMCPEEGVNSMSDEKIVEYMCENDYISSSCCGCSISGGRYSAARMCSAACQSFCSEYCVGMPT